nr:MAG TPA: hypothetical protein [Caudoviricetes sp.]
MEKDDLPNLWVRMLDHTWACRGHVKRSRA